MLLITCPVCAITADETEFSCGGQYDDGAQDTSYMRGPVQEWWLCRNGCGAWFGLMRHSVNQRIHSVWRHDSERTPEETA